MIIENYNFAGKKVLIRVDFNVPLNEKHEITDDTRIRASLPTINHILKKGGSVILMSHLGRPKNGHELSKSLQHLVPHLSQLLGLEVQFANDCLGTQAKEKAAALKSGEVLLLENLRFYKHETAGDESMAKQLASYGDVFVNDAFGTAHRAHASTTIVAKYFEEKMFGFLIEKEIRSVQKVFGSSKKTVLAIVGGAKVSSKITILKNLLDKVDTILIGGGMAYTFLKAKGASTGNSLVEQDMIITAKEILQIASEKGVTIVLPIDTICADTFSNDASIQSVDSMKIPDGWMGMDIGTKAIAEFCRVITNSATILWNGPVGVFEMDNFSAGTKAVASAVANATDKGAFSLVGGGDSVAAVNLYKFGSRMSHVSTGGGAMLEFLEGKDLPGIMAISGSMSLS